MWNFNGISMEHLMPVSVKRLTDNNCSIFMCMRIAYLLFFILLTFQTAVAQSNWVWFQDFQYAGNNKVKSITELNGNIWIAKNNYILELDTLTGKYQIFDYSKLPPYNYGLFKSIATDGINHIYVNYYGSSYGLLVYDGTTWTNYPIPGFQGYAEFGMPVEVASNGHVFIASGSQVGEFDGVSWQVDTSSFGYCICGAMDEADSLWLGTQNGQIISYYEGNFNLEYQTTGGTPVYSLCSDRNGNIYFNVSTSGSIAFLKYNHGVTDTILLPVVISQPYLDPLITTMNDNLVFEYDSNMYVYADSSWIVYHPGGFGDYASIYCDSLNQLWLGYSNGYIIKTDLSQNEIFNASYSALPSDTVTSLASYEPGSYLYDVIAGTPLGIASINTLDLEVTHVYDTTNSILAEDKITCLSREGGFYVQWIGTNHGLYRWALDSTWQEFNTQNSGLPNDSITCIFLSTDINEAWIGTRNGLAKLENDSVWTIYNSSNSPLPSNHIQCLSSYGGMYIGTDSGLAFLKDSTWQFWNTSNSALPSNDITALDNTYLNLWVGTRDAGLCDSSFTSGLWSYYNTSNGFPSDSIAVIKGDFHEVWEVYIGVGTIGGGICFINNSGSFTTVNEVEGISFKNAYDIWQNSVGFSLQSWVGTEKGALYTVIYGDIPPVNESLLPLKAYFNSTSLIIKYHSDEKSAATVQIYDLLGRLHCSMRTSVVPGDNMLQLQPPTLNSQVYIVSLTTALHKEAVKVLKY